MVTQSWSVVPPRVKSIKGTPKGKKEKMEKEMVKAKPAKAKMEKEKSRATILQKPKRDVNLDNNA